jgi:hypothetical protein
MNPVTEVLTTAKALIADPARWIKEHYAMCSEGYPLDVMHDEAVNFDAEGALHRAAGVSTTVFLLGSAGVAQELLRKAMHGSILVFNDERTHPEVMAAFDAAIAESGSAS